MKFVLVLFLLSTLLFSAQRQVIVGCYSVQGNGESALGILNKQIEDNSALKEVMEQKSLRAINTSISAYTVVSVNYLESYTDTYATMKALEPFYNDVYSLPYPTRGIKDKEYLKDVKKKAEAEVKELEATKLESELVVEEVLVEEKIEIKPVEVPVFEVVKELEPVVEPMKVQEDIVEDNGSTLSNTALYLIGGFVLLLLIIGGIVISRQLTSKDTQE